MYLESGGQDAAYSIHRIREFYRQNFINGQYDESFITWLESAMERAREIEHDI